MVLQRLVKVSQEAPFAQSSLPMAPFSRCNVESTPNNVQQGKRADHLDQTDRDYHHDGFPTHQRRKALPCPHYRKYSFLPGLVGGTHLSSSFTALKSLKFGFMSSPMSHTDAILPHR